MLNNVTLEDAVMQEEIFGPILPIISVKGVDEAIGIINARPKPLALYLFTSDKMVEEKVLSRTSYGGGCINDTIIHLEKPHRGFGGVGDSGMGADHGKASVQTLTE